MKQITHTDPVEMFKRAVDTQYVPPHFAAMFERVDRLDVWEAALSLAEWNDYSVKPSLLLKMYDELLAEEREEQAQQERERRLHEMRERQPMPNERTHAEPSRIDYAALYAIHWPHRPPDKLPAHAPEEPAPGPPAPRCPRHPVWEIINGSCAECDVEQALALRAERGQAPIPAAALSVRA